MTTSTMRLSYDRAVAAVRNDFHNAFGSVFYPVELTVYVDTVQHDIIPTGRLIACKVIATPDADLLHDTGGFLDPYWNVEVISDPEGVLPEGYNPGSCWAFGPSYEYRKG